MDVVLAGAHGGAGTSTLAALLPAAWDMGSIGQLLDLGQAQRLSIASGSLQSMPVACSAKV
ncbi:hypothetical protein AB0C69_39635 [Actinomadura sp. NPDC048032]|uniref:hypothetical protein n=1 Tax=Actinomadura sp. NPDC048032 TaxID=3155747 RepID=UPI0034031862